MKKIHVSAILILLVVMSSCAGLIINFKNSQLMSIQKGMPCFGKIPAIFPLFHCSIKASVIGLSKNRLHFLLCHSFLDTH